MPLGSETPLQPPGRPQTRSAACAQPQGTVPGSTAGRQQPAWPGEGEWALHRPSEQQASQPQHRCMTCRRAAQGLLQSSCTGSVRPAPGVLGQLLPTLAAPSHSPCTTHRSLPGQPRGAGAPASWDRSPSSSRAPSHPLGMRGPRTHSSRCTQGFQPELPARLRAPRTWGTPQGPSCRKSQTRGAMTVITVTPCRSSPEGTNSPQGAVEAGSSRARQRERAQGQLRQSAARGAEAPFRCGRTGQHAPGMLW